MCGICGVYNARSGEPIPRIFLERMTRLISHRGPDESGTYVDAAAGLGFARLSIIDLNGSHQPMSNEAGDTWVVFNGEIWNYKTLRKELLEKGHQFRTSGDTEVIVHAYEEYGVDCVAHLHGMFGFAIWDGSRKRLLLARDRLGKKPLYYILVDGDLVFASEIKALLLDRRVKRQIDVQSLADFLSIRYVPGPATLFAGIYKVQPGHFLLFEDGVLRDECYWDFSFDETESRPVAEYIAGIKQHVRRAVQERLMADVPLGALLSGGVDSSIIVGTMSALNNTPVKTFSVGFDVTGYNELPYARLVAEYFKTEHFELTVSSTDLLQYWPLLTWYRDEPVSEASDLGVYLISRFARQQVKAVFSGEGGDELFAGYPKYAFDWLAKYYHLLPITVRESVITALLDRFPYGMRKLKLVAHALSQPAPQRWISWFGIFNGPLKERLLSSATRASIDLDASRIFRSCLEEHPQRDDLSSMLYLDTKFWLPDNLLMKADKMSMAASLEARLPLLDSRLVEYAASIPSNIKIKPFRSKYLLKRAFADMLPQPILARKKVGFTVPIGTWFRQGQRSFITNILLSERTRSRGFLNNECVEHLVHDHLEGKTNYQLQLFILASLELWFRIFMDNTNLESPQMPLEELIAETSLVSEAKV
jgi:asparagine synthase (glutamine-hydrolysing)